VLPTGIVMPRTYTFGDDLTHNDNQRIKQNMRCNAYFTATWIRQGRLQTMWPHHFGGVFLQKTRGLS